MTLSQDIADNSPLLLSAYGLHLALGFKGSPDFIRRCYNWSVNTGVIDRGCRLTWYHGESGRLAYVCPKDMRAIRRGVYLQHRAEIVLAREIPLKADHTRDDDWEGNPDDVIQLDTYRIARLAAVRTKAFMREHIVHDSFVTQRPDEAPAPVYGLGAIGRAERGDE